MSQKVTVVIDAMGGDNAPHEIVKGTFASIQTDPDLHIILTGNKKLIEKSMQVEDLSSDRVTIVHCTEVVEMAEHPVNAIRNKKDSSLVRAMNIVKEGNADAVFSAGNSGAVLVGGQMIVGRIKGVERPCLAPIIPTENGPCIIVDAGANMDAKPSWLVQWAQMGYIYSKLACKTTDPKVGLANIGAEKEKGNKLIQEVYPMLEELDDINFTGSIEIRDITAGLVDVVVCDAFVGNVIIKMFEGAAKTILSETKKALTASPVSKIGALLIKKDLKNVLSKYNPNAYGGATLLGARNLVVKGHGNSKEKQVKIAVDNMVKLVRADTVAKIEQNILKNNMDNTE